MLASFTYRKKIFIVDFGLVLSLTLLWSSPEIAGLRFDVHTLLVAAALCFVGFQLISDYVRNLAGDFWFLAGVTALIGGVEKYCFPKNTATLKSKELNFKVAKKTN